MVASTLLGVLSIVAKAATLDLTGAMTLALEKNLDVRLSVFSIGDKEAALTKTMGDFDFNLSGTVTRDHAETPSSSSLDGVGSVVRSDSMSYKPTLSRKTIYGTELSVPYSYTTSESNSSYNRIPVGHNTSLALKVTQPLLKPFQDDYFRRNIRRAEFDLAQARAKHGEKLDDTALRAAELFLETAREQQTLRVQEMMYENARQAEEFVKLKKRVGKSSSIEVLEAEAATSKALDGVLSSRLSMATKMDDLSIHVFGQTQTIDLSDGLKEFLGGNPRNDLNSLVALAQKRRSERVSQVQATKKSEVELSAARADLLPTFNFESSYTHKGLAEGFGASQQQVSRGDFPSWSLGLKLERPIMQYAARAALDAKRFAYEQQRLKEAVVVRDIEIEVRKSIRDVDVNWERLQALRNAAMAQRQRIEAVAEKFKAGQISVSDMNRARADAETSEVDEIKSRYAYVKSRLKLMASAGTLLDYVKSTRGLINQPMIE